LPEAHVEASTEGSIILASLLLKLGGYGFLRTSLPICVDINSFGNNFIYIFCTFGVFFCSFIALRQNDLKKIIAYSSVAHMNLVVLGLFSNSFQGLQGAIFMMVGHALSSSGLFFLVGCLYDRYRSRLVNYYGNLVQTMPVFSFFMLLYCLTNFSLPGTCNFMGEILILFGIFGINNFVLFIVVVSTLITLIYSILLLNKLIYGTSKMNYICKFTDLQV